MPVVTRMWDEDGKEEYEDKLVRCNSRLVVERDGWVSVDFGGEQDDEGEGEWRIKCIDSGHVLAVPYDDTNGPTVPASESLDWVERVLHWVKMGGR